VGQIYFGDSRSKWVSFQSALTVWRHAVADASVRLDYVFLHEGVLRAMLCGLGTHAGWRAVYWAYGACFYDARLAATVMLSSNLPDTSTGQGGKFMQDIGRADDVIVVLSRKYLQSRYCMRELLYMYDRSLGERPELMARIVPVVMEDLRIDDPLQRLAHAEYWQSQHDALCKRMEELGVAVAGGAARDDLLAMKDFMHRVDDLLDWLSDVVMPRVRRDDAQPTIQAVIAMLLERRKQRTQ
jgi:hypothetical protein